MNAELKAIIAQRAAAQTRVDKLRNVIAEGIKVLGYTTLIQQFIDELIASEKELARLNAAFDAASEDYRNGR